MVSQEMLWILVLIAVNLAKGKMSNYYVFKEKEPRQEYTSLCEDGAYIGMQESGYMDSKKFSIWMSFLLNYCEWREFDTSQKKIANFGWL